MEAFTLEGEGLMARAICHECAHLDGELYVDLVEGELMDVSELEQQEEAPEEVEDSEGSQTSQKEPRS